MYVALMADDNKKDLMVQFCTAYAGILSRHHLGATSTTGKLVAAETGLHIHLFLSGELGGDQQIGARIAYNEMDMILFFVDPNNHDSEKELLYISWLCNQNNIPLATNLATAEMLVLGMDRGDLDWRTLVNPKGKLKKDCAWEFSYQT